MVNYVKVTNRMTFQHKIFPELNSKKHTPSPTVWFLRNCAKLKLRNCAKLKFRKSGIGQFLREMTLRMIAQIVVFFAQNWCAKKEKFCVSFRKNCAKVLRMETLISLSWKICLFRYILMTSLAIEYAVLQELKLCYMD